VNQANHVAEKICDRGHLDVTANVLYGLSRLAAPIKRRLSASSISVSNAGCFAAAAE
jgi:hypothetical protein